MGELGTRGVFSFFFVVFIYLFTHHDINQHKDKKDTAWKYKKHEPQTLKPPHRHAYINTHRVLMVKLKKTQKDNVFGK